MFTAQSSYCFEQRLEKKHHNQWCLVLVKTEQTEQTENISHPLQIFIHYDDSQEWEANEYVSSCQFLPTNYKIAIIYLPDQITKLRISSHIQQNQSSLISRVGLYPLPRSIAAGLLIGLNPIPILKTLLGSPIHLKKRLRSAISQNYLHHQQELTYTNWCQLYDRWTEEDQQQLKQSDFYDQWPVVNTQLYCPPDYSETETTYALQNQWDLKQTSTSNIKYLAIVQNGEIITPYAYDVFADQAARHHFPAALYADSDSLNQDQQRYNPHFKPDIGFLTLSSGLLTQDIWLFREDIVHAYQQENPNHSFQSAYTHRLALALFILEKNQPIHHIPFVLSHRKIAPTPSTSKSIGNLVTEYLKEKNWQGSVHDHSFPVKLVLSDQTKPISLVIPTTISTKRIQTCIAQIIEKTIYPSFEVILVISQNTRLTQQQIHYLRPLLKKYTQLRIVKLHCNRFNFSQSCNFGIQHAKYDTIAIVNDDIVPKTPYWLNYMAGHLQDPNVGAVGAKLYYPNGQIQHAGIIMGMANLCEHAGRFQSKQSFMMTYDHNVSAVTGACMLIRRSAYNDVNGFNENYEIAYNDIDFCLRLRQAGYQIIQSQQAELIHYESMTLGNHYTGERQGKERQEIIAIRQQWRSIDNHDPFYNPNLSLQRGMDYQLAFPPRIQHPIPTI